MGRRQSKIQYPLSAMKSNINAGLYRRSLIALAVGGLLAALAPAKAENIKVKLVNDDCLIIPLAQKQGYFTQEGLDVSVVKGEEYTPSHDDYDTQIPLNTGELTADLNWFHHVMYGAANNAPVKAVVLIQNAPGMKIMVANRVKDQIKSAADFGGRNIATGALFSTKTYLTQYLMIKNGADPKKCASIGVENAGRYNVVSKALDDGTVDVLTFMEPMTSKILQTGKVSVLYDLSSAEGTAKAFGTYWPAQSLFFASNFVEQHPDVVQHLVNAFVRALRFVNSHTAEQIVAALPDSYFEKADHAARLQEIKLALPTFARSDYSFSPEAVKLVRDAVFISDFDGSAEGQWRLRAKKVPINLNEVYDNRFVQKAMTEIK
jgi:NitT/TauT family transport system substrate-binding protein